MITHVNKPSAFANWLLEELIKRGWSQADLSRRANLSRTAVSNILTGNRAPGPDFCRAVARALGYPQELVFRKAGLIDDPPPPDYDPNLRIALHLLANLPPEERQEILEYIQFKAARAANRPKAKRAGQPALER